MNVSVQFPARSAVLRTSVKWPLRVRFILNHRLCSVLQRGRWRGERAKVFPRRREERSRGDGHGHVFLIWLRSTPGDPALPHANSSTPHFDRRNGSGFRKADSIDQTRARRTD